MMLLDEIKSALELFASNCKLACRIVMEGSRGINDKINKNTLIGSNLYNEIDASVEDIDFIRLLLNDYIVYVEGGRRPGKWPPPLVIAAWCQRKGLPSDNKTVYLICKSIYMKGISPRPLFDGAGGIWEEIDDAFDTFADDLFDIFQDAVNRLLNFKNS